MSYPINRKALAQGHLEEGLRKLDEGAAQQAVPCFETAVALAPADPAILYHLGRAQVQCGRFAEGEQALREALDLDPGHAPAAHLLGAVLAQDDRLDEAAAWLRKGAQGLPDSAQVFRDLGAVELFLGETDGARAHFMRALELDVHTHEVLFNLVRITDMAAQTPQAALLLDALNVLASKAGSLSAQQGIQVYFALAKAYDDRADPETAFSWMRVANEAQRRALAYDGEAHARRLRRIAEVFDRPLFDRLAGQGDPTDRPIFILGMPRSGTTLVEQIVSSHPQVYGAGETAALMHMVDHSHGPSGARFPEWAAGMTPTDCPTLAKAYFDRLPALGDGQTRTTDKRLENVELIGLIHLLAPNAPIIRLERDPRDVALSCYALLFADYQHWSYDFDDIARYWREYERLMDHWERVLPPGRILTVSYEALVADVEPEARRMLDHCGLTRDPACLEYHKSRRPVRSASAAQVRQPIYDTSIGRWRRYAPQMAPLFEAMGLAAEPVVAARPRSAGRKS